ncbi:acetyl-CoA hydrolase/transferase C-terminal domain-containing protein [Pseudomonas sp. MDMC216]|jgi:acyl-CoA hydrolase|nr:MULTISPECIES: acetyl-CoA hydrolase/transferase C-terminal domain-containing protein [Pseudomonas]MDH1562142.1 acetyl-CoA hydrolase/transferase family protein [Pseudomonas chengduensis]MDI5995075.1 acetyl-CoA hydrolase/transferase C-terminal domain-containing protein [Pseudomonas sp. MDMC216]MDI6006891.1 acetyl-CoA hydrolase/transferase C-terminal domain-containing protein [Pseudomonas sp. MDMC17]MDZ4194590.1 acetyl-CoA hydrolase/transferase C-terminal domain-containing protein [Pseudomonas s
MPHTCTLEQAVERVLSEIAGPIHLGLPLGLGKPNRWVNALYARVRETPERQLTIYTALCLARPRAAQDLQRRFLEPFVDRVYGDYPELDFLADLHSGKLPSNVRVEQFFFQPGSLLECEPAQQDYISSNYSHVARDLNAKGLNLVAQLVAVDAAQPEHFSLSCNPDVTLDLLPLLDKRRKAGETVLSVAQIHSDLPYMAGDAQVSRDTFDIHIGEDECTTLFSTPNMPVTLQDHCIGLFASTLVRDGGTLQIGIGAMGDALASALMARQDDNARYRALLQALHADEWAGEIAASGGLEPLDQGLYGCSEMFVNGLLALAEAGLLRRRVYPDLRLQRLARSGALDEKGRPHSVQALVDAGLPTKLQPSDLAWLRDSGMLRGEIRLEKGELHLPDGSRVAADLSDPQAQAHLQSCLGSAQGGVVLHGGFFLGPESFYRRLRELDDSERQRFAMTGIRYINELYGEEELKRLQRRDARFINTAFTMTLLGAGVADQLEDGRVLSGVGGQYNFVAQAHALEDARSILLLRSWRESGGEVNSNIVWEYGHATIPRHLRDIVVTEYGIADLRGKTDAQVIEALLKISDSRFQNGLIEQAQQAGKLPADFRLDERFGNNLPERLQALRTEHSPLFAEYPLGSDFSTVEQDLVRALSWLKSKLRLTEVLELGRATLDAPEPAAYAEHLRRMSLEAPDGVREALYQRLLLAGLQATSGP